MSDYISGAIRFTGLGSGTDFDSIIDQLKEVESIPMNRQKLWKADWQERYDAFEELLTQIAALQTSLGKFDTVSELLSKSVASSNSSVAGAAATGEAMDGAQNIEVFQLATNAVLTNSKTFTSKDTVVTDGNTADMQYFDYTYKGETRSVKIARGTTLQGLVDQINRDAEVGGIKVTASLIKSGDGYLFQLQGNDTGESADLSIASTSTVPGFGPEAALVSDTRYTGNADTLKAALTLDYNGQTYTVDTSSDTRYRSGSSVADADGKLTGAPSFTYNGKTYNFGSTLRQTLSGQEISGQYGLGTFTQDELKDDASVTRGFSFKYTDENGNAHLYQYNPSTTPKTIAELREDITNVTGGAVSLSTENGFRLKENASGKNILAVGSAISVSLTYTDDTGTEQTKTYTYDPATATDQDAKNLDDIADEINALCGVDIAKISGNGLSLMTKSGSNLAQATQAISFDYRYLDENNAVQTFTYSYDPAAGGTKTLQQVADEINEQSNGKVTASVVGNATDGFRLELKGTDPEGSTDDSGNPLGFTDTGTGLEAENTTIDDVVAAINKTTSATGLSAVKVEQDDGTFILELKGDKTILEASGLNGTGITFAAASKTMSEVVEEINGLTGTDDKALFQAQMVKWGDGSGYSLEIKATSGDSEQIIASSFNQVGGGDADWTKREARNAEFSINGLPNIFTSETNQLTEVFPGMTVNLTDTGKTTLTVTTDTASLREKIVEFVDAANELLTKFKNLTEVDEDKNVASMDTSESASLYNSLYDSQMGSILTGNYGVQLLYSQLKTTLTGRAEGFTAKTEDGRGDLFTSLANIGIVTDSDESSPTFGQLKILEEGDDLKGVYKTLDEVLAEDPKAVADILAGTGGTTSTTDIRYESSLAGTTRGGTYEVTYTVNDDGTVGDVYIGGLKAQRDENGQYTVLQSGHPANGLAISLNNLDPGEHTSTVSIKQGKIRALSDFLAEQSKNDPAYIDGARRGALMVLKDNYQDIMDGIDEKIEREQNRISLWETRMKAKFARLETLLTQYNNISSSNAAALATAIDLGGSE